jgi:hypothetical protein
LLTPPEPIKRGGQMDHLRDPARQGFQDGIGLVRGRRPVADHGRACNSTEAIMSSSSLCLSGLIDKRAELAGEIRLLEERLEQLRSDVLHVDATIRLIDPAYRVDAVVPKVRRPRRDWFGRGELLRSILETLRKAPEPLTAREIALALMSARDSTRTTRRVERRVDSTVGRREGADRTGGVRAATGGVADCRELAQ